MRLIFEWIKCDEYGVINDFGINFTDDYNISYDSNLHVLSIRKKESCIPHNFYSINGSNVVKQVTCILGKNGSGKTSLLKHIFKIDLLRTDEYLQNYPYFNTIQVIEYKGKLNIYHNQSKIFINSDVPFDVWDVTTRKTVNETLEDGNYAHTSKIFISNDYFGGLNNNFTIKGYQSRVAYTPYDIGVLQSGFLELITKQSNSMLVWRNLIYKFNKYLQNHTNKQFFQNILYGLFIRTLIKSNKRTEFKYFNNVKIIFQSIRESDAYLEKYNLYNFLMGRFPLEKIISNTIDKKKLDEFAALNNIELDYDLLKICAIHSLVIKELSVESSTIYSNLKINLITEILISLTDFLEDICVIKNYNVKDLLQILEAEIQNSIKTSDFNDNHREIKIRELKYFQAANESIEKLKCVIPTVENASTFLLDDNLQFLEYMYDEIKSRNSFVLKYFWLNYGCSAGERAFLNIFADLNSLFDFKYLSDSAVNGTNKQIVLMLDEPDLYCHPEWQRKMLHKIIETMELLYQGYSFHIIISTHSPLLLSDIPKENIVLFDNGDDGIYFNKAERKQTFGANIFDLYNDSFLLDSFIGEFSKYKIGKIIKKISEWYGQNVIIPSEELHSAEMIVNLIGEPILKNKLKNMLCQIRERR